MGTQAVAFRGATFDAIDAPNLHEGVGLLGAAKQKRLTFMVIFQVAINWFLIVSNGFYLFVLIVFLIVSNDFKWFLNHFHFFSNWFQRFLVFV